jgi:hypothetical protein
MRTRLIELPTIAHRPLIDPKKTSLWQLKSASLEILLCLDEVVFLVFVFVGCNGR